MEAHFNLQRLIGRKEDHLTALFALALELDPPFASSCARLLLAGMEKTTPDAFPEIAAVEVQRAFPLGTPDIVLTLSDGRLIAVENKLEAPETQVYLPDDEQPAVPAKTPQLAKYLRIPELAAVAFIRATHKPPSAEVLKDARYLRPEGSRDHFLWRDFLPLMEASKHPVTSWLAKAFRFNGFVPPDATIGDLDDPDRKRNFKLLWESTGELAKSLGWKVNTGATKELYFSAKPSSIVSFVWANPTTGELQIRLHPRSAGALPELQSRIGAVLDSVALSERPAVELTTTGRSAGKATVVDVFVPLEAVVGRGSAVAVIAERLRSYVGAILRAL